MKLNNKIIELLANELVLVRNDNNWEGSDLFQALMTQLEEDTTIGSQHDDVCELADQIEEANGANCEGAEYE